MTGSGNGPTSKTISLRTIAEAGGVSINTVSLALRGSKRVKAATSKRILTLAKNLGYRPNLIARCMITGKSSLIGVLIPGHNFSYLPRLIESMQNAALEAELGLLILSFQRGADEATIARHIDYFLQHRVDGIIALPPTPPLPERIWTPMRDIPSVWVGVGGSQCFGRDLILPPEGAGRISVAELVNRRLSRLVYAGPNEDFFSQGRWGGVAEEAKRQRIPRPLRWDVPDTIAGGVTAAKLWIERPSDKRPRGFIGFTDTVAVGFLHHLLINGYQVPEQVSVVGADDTLVAAGAALPLTTIRAPVEQMGRLAVQSIVYERTDLPPIEWEWLERENLS